MLAQQGAVPEGGGELVDELPLPVGQGQGVFGVHRGEILVQQLVGDAPQLHRPLLEVDLGEDDPVGHVVLGVAQQQLVFQLHLDDGDGLVHLGGQGHIHRVVDILVQHMGDESLTGVVPVDLGGEHGQGP